jgi:(p)ppGpp synthase/HD superfamily hydrolase
MMEIPLIERAARLAVLAHDGQVRKSDGSPYIVHPFMVARILTAHGFDETVIAAGLTHDVLEDTHITADMLRAELGDVVLTIVQGVTEDKSLVWEERKEAYAQTIAEGPETVKAVSIADKIHNMESMIAGLRHNGPEFWEKFSRGRDAQCWFAHLMEDAYMRDWEHSLIAVYRAHVREFESL